MCVGAVPKGDIYRSTSSRSAHNIYLLYAEVDSACAIFERSRQADRLFFGTGELTVGRARVLGGCAFLFLWFGIGSSGLHADATWPTTPVALTYLAPEATSVAVAGSFDPFWQKLHPLKKDAKGRWLVVLPLAPGRYELHFLVDGKWRHDARLPSVDDGLGGRNNVLVVVP